jgi:adenylate cyclase
MAEERVQRRLAAILAADVVGYSRLVERDEAGTVARLKKLQEELIQPIFARDGGRIVKFMGDGVLVEFGSAVDAVRSALAIQTEMTRSNAEVSEEDRIVLRVGINIGDVIIDDEDIHGDGVNVAARLEGLCGPGEVYVSGTVRDHVEGKLEAKFDDLGEQSVKNIARPVSIFRAQLRDSVAAAASNMKKVPATSGRPSIAVLPFSNISGDPEQEYFADGITEDIITGLSRIRWFLVIARNSTFSYKGDSPDVRQVARELDVRYVLEGSVRKAGNRVRITAQLIDASNGSHIWADRYDRELADIFAVQDEITETVVTAIEPELSRVEQERARRKRSDDLDAWDCYQRGMWHVWHATQEDVEQARSLFQRAVQIDPQFAGGYAGLAIADTRSARIGMADDPAEVLRRGEALRRGTAAADKAIAIDAREAAAYVAKSFAAMFSADQEGCIKAATEAIAINPNLAIAHLGKGMALAHTGRGEEALSEFATMERLSPRDPMLWLCYHGRAIAMLFCGEDQAALDLSEKAIQLPNSLVIPHVVRFVALTRLGRNEDARAEHREMVCLVPTIVDDFGNLFPHAREALEDIYRDSLRRAEIID